MKTNTKYIAMCGASHSEFENTNMYIITYSNFFSELNNNTPASPATMDS